MSRSLFRHVAGLVAGAALALSLGTAPAQGASLTFNDPNCAAFSVTGSNGSFTLNCQTLACSISASPASPGPGQQVTLTGSCTGGGTVTYTWTSLTTGDPNCVAPSSSTGSPVIVSPPAGTTQTCSYRVSGTDGTSSGTATTSVAWSNAPPPAPTGCTLTATPSNLTAPGNVTLTAACSGGGAPTTWAWTGAGVVAQTSAPSQIVQNVSATTTFGVTPSNGATAGNTAQATVTVGAPPPPAGSTCTINGGTYTILDMGPLPFTQNVSTTNMTGGKVAIGTLVVPSGLNTTVATLSAFDWGSTTPRKMWLSKSRCDTPGWTPPVAPGTTGATQNPTLYFSIGGTDPSAVIMQPGETWYVMVVNWDFLNRNSCTGTCNLGVTWSRPN